MSARSSVLTGDDGRVRCGWVGVDPEYQRYHDEEWGVPLHGDRPLFEKLSLEAFQSGLSWLTILRRRAAFRSAFCGFDIARIAAFDETDVERLVLDASIIRNRAKIAATIGNARVAKALIEPKPGALDDLMWGHAARKGSRPSTLDDVPTATAESTALSVQLRALGFRFVGPTTIYALMQSTGMVDDHVVGCFRARQPI